MNRRLPKLVAALATSWLSFTGTSIGNWSAAGGGSGPVLFVRPAHAQVTAEPSAVVFPDPTKFARGLYTEGEIGSVALFGRAGDDVSPGFAVGARLGYDLTRWLAVQGHLLGSTHETRGSSPESGQLLQTYQAIAELKLTWRFAQTSLFGEGGFGAERLSTNVLYTLGIERYRVGAVAGGGAGVDYHSLSRHFSVGLRGGFYRLFQVTDSEELMATAYLRYTF